MRPLVVLGDAFLDRDLARDATRLCPDGPAPIVEDVTERCRPGGAALAAYLAALEGAEVHLCCALGADAAGAVVRRLLCEAGVEVRAAPAAVTGEKTRLRAGATTVARVDRGPRRQIPLPGANLAPLGEALRRAGAIVVSDYGRGMCGEPVLREALAEARRRGTPIVWDPHPNGAIPFPGCSLVTPNEREVQLAAGVAPRPGTRLAELVHAAREVARRWVVQGVVVTLGERGALLVEGEGLPMICPAPSVVHEDACGAGDRFAAAAGLALARGAVLSWAVGEATAAAAAFVAGGGSAALVEMDRTPTPRSSGTAEGGDALAPGATIGLERARVLAAETHARGGRVVVTGGCFDLLHAGHIALLESARALGDCLIVCVNSDASVRRAKGPDRPLVTLVDRIRVLASLSSVDAVVAFEEDTPAQCLRDVRPDLFVKGGDYFGARVAEEEVLAELGGQVIVLPYLPGHSTTRIVARAAQVGALR